MSGGDDNDDVAVRGGNRHRAAARENSPDVPVSSPSSCDRAGAETTTATATTTANTEISPHTAEEHRRRRDRRGRNHGAAASRNDDRHRPKELHIAPMLDVSYREFRNFVRIFTRRAVLWTEMVVDETIAYSTELDTHLGFDPAEHPIVCQIGGNSPVLCGDAVDVVDRQYGFDEVNLNVDCPSKRVSGERQFGAVLMKHVSVAKAVVASMSDRAASASSPNIPVSIKCRIGIDDLDSFEYAAHFIEEVRPVCKRFVLHARKCILGGLSPAQNRIVPPLNYPRVYDLCRKFPDCDFWINGGLPGLKAAKLVSYGDEGGCDENDDGNGQGLRHAVPCQICAASNGSCTAPPRPIAPPNLRGCMVGRLAMDNPSALWDVDRYFYGESNPCKNRREVLEKYCQYLERVYPRRCCDDDERMTRNISTGRLDGIVRVRECCDVCRDVYGGTTKATMAEEEEDDEEKKDGVGDDDGNGERTWMAVPPDACVAGGRDGGPLHEEKKEKGDGHRTADPSDDGNKEEDDDDAPASNAATTNNFGKKHKRHRGTKITAHVIGRCLKPVNNLFFHMPGSRAFRARLQKLTFDFTVRNCGPGFILRKAMEVVPSDVLDRDFVKTEDVPDEEIVLHVAPSTCGRRCRGEG